MNVIVLQNKVAEHISDSIDGVYAQIEQANIKQVDFIVLPEMFMSPYDLNSFQKNSQTLADDVILFLSNLAREYQAYVIGGSIPFEQEGKLYNTSFVFNRSGKIILRYDKMYLFEVTYPDGSTFRERDVLEAGDIPGVFDTEFGKMGLMICFDIRFPELADRIAKQGVKAIFVPAAFNTFTGPLHWHTTFRARAIDNQLFVIVASPSRDSFGDYEVYGHSMIVSPLGKIIKELNEAPDIIETEIDLGEVEHARNVIPIIKNKRS